MTDRQAGEYERELATAREWRLRDYGSANYLLERDGCVDEDRLDEMLVEYARQRDQEHARRLDQWRNRARLFRDAYEGKSCEVTALTIQKLDLESLGDDAMRIQRDRARESAKKLIEAATRNLKTRSESAETLLSELLQAAKDVLSPETNVGWVLSLRGDPEVATLRSVVEKARKVVGE